MRKNKEELDMLELSKLEKEYFEVEFQGERLSISSPTLKEMLPNRAHKNNGRYAVLCCNCAE